MALKHRIAGSGAVGLLAITALAGPTLASSHADAPAIAFDPAADITDLYAFVSPDAPDTVTLIADFGPLQEPAGGPGFYPFDPSVLYWIKVDNNGDAVADVTYTFRFTTNVTNPDSFLYSGYGSIPGNEANVTQGVSVTRNDEPLGLGLSVPPPNIGQRTTPGYAALAANFINPLLTADGSEVGKVFAGSRDDPFFADTGAFFDLIGLRPSNPAHQVKLKKARGQDALSGYNVNSIAIQVPKGQLTSDGQAPVDETSDNAVIGVWAGTSRMQNTALAGDGTAEASGPWVQVSRLGNPLINEVFIPLGQKDLWNASEPKDDAQFQDRYLNPELAVLINTFYPGLPDARTADRQDLVYVLGQGVPGVNQTNPTGFYDMLRLNMGEAVAAKPNRLGVMAGDFQGFPNGRRPGDDVVDFMLRAAADGYGKVFNTAGGDLFPNVSPNSKLGDGCDANDARPLTTFPYLATPWNGYTGGPHRKSPCKP